jgi:hypothetical protein
VVLVLSAYAHSSTGRADTRPSTAILSLGLFPALLVCAAPPRGCGSALSNDKRQHLLLTTRCNKAEVRIDWQEAVNHELLPLLFLRLTRDQHSLVLTAEPHRMWQRVSSPSRSPRVGRPTALPLPFYPTAASLTINRYPSYTMAVVMGL